jgi:hypothetical protein
MRECFPFLSIFPENNTMKASAVYIFSCVLFMLSCGKKTECPPVNIVKTELAGSWHDNRPKENVFAGTRYDFSFQPDSFTLVLRQWSDAVDTNCQRSDYKEYVKGSYVFTTSNNVLSINGLYTDSLFQEKTSGCYSVGQYKRDFKVVKKCSTLELDEIGNLSYGMVIKLSR